MALENESISPVALLKGSTLFADLDEDTAAQLAKAARARKYEKGEIVFLEGAEPEGIYLIEEGWLKASKISPEGREQVLDALGPGYLVNIQNIFTGSPMLVTLEALEASKLWFIPTQVITMLIEQHPNLSQAIIRTLAQRLEFLAAKVEDLALRSVDARLAKYLLGQAQKGRVERHAWATQSELAAQIGTVLDVLNRSLKKFEEKQLIEVKRREILILDEAKLQEIASE